MTGKMERLMVSIPSDVKSEIDTIKQQQFYDKPYAELYRYIISLGLTKIKETEILNRGETYESNKNRHKS